MNRIISWIRQVISKLFNKQTVAQVTGADLAVSDKMAAAIDLWGRMYMGDAPWLAPPHMRSLNLPAQIASDIAQLPYVENAASIATYGLVERPFVDERFTDKQSLLERANVLLAGLSVPYESFSVSVADLHKITGQEDDTPRIGKLVKWRDRANHIVSITTIHDAIGQDEIEIANKPSDIASSISDMAERQRINAMYAQGATNVYAFQGADNCDPTHPLRILFDVPNEAVNINKIRISWVFEPFRAYSTGASSTQASTVGETKTTSKTQELVPLERTWPSDVPDDGVGFHSHIQTLIAHEHQVNVSITIPGHTHSIKYGIYEGGSANALSRITLNGIDLPLPSGRDIDIATILAESDGGKINRGQVNEILLYPNGLGYMTMKRGRFTLRMKAASQ